MSQDQHEKEKLVAGTVSPQDELHDILYKMEQDPTLMGISSLAKDGVVRSWTADRDVVDAVPLRPALIKAYLDTFPCDQNTEAMFRGVDGRTVPQEQWLNPPEELRPPPLREEHRERDNAELQRNRQRYQEKREQMATGQTGCCAPKVRSDNKLE